MGHDYGLYRIYMPRTRTILTTKHTTIDEERYPLARDEEDDKGSHLNLTERKILTSQKVYDDETAQYGQEIDSDQTHLPPSQQDTKNVPTKYVTIDNDKSVESDTESKSIL